MRTKDKTARKGAFVMLTVAPMNDDVTTGQIGEILEKRRSKWISYPYRVQFDGKVMPLARDEFEVL